MIVGQSLDLLAPQGPELPAQGVLEVQRLKTGSYTFELPLRLGALLAGAAPQVLAALTGYALPLGQAFQIADDLLGSFGDPAATGKTNASDLREGKRTLLVARALEMASAEDAARLRAGLGRPDADPDELREILRRSGAADAARRSLTKASNTVIAADAEKLCQMALEALESRAIPATVRPRLREIALYAIQRAL